MGGSSGANSYRDSVCVKNGAGNNPQSRASRREAVQTAAGEKREGGTKSETDRLDAKGDPE